MNIKLLLLLACAGVALRPADGTLLATKKLAAIAVAAVKKPLVALGLAEGPSPTPLAHNSQPIATVYEVPLPAPQHSSGKQPTTIILNVGNQVAQQQPPVQEGYFSSSQGFLPSRRAPQAPVVHTPLFPGRHVSPPSAPGHPLWGVPGALASLWSRTQQAVVEKTNRVRDRYTPLKPLSQLLYGTGGIRKPAQAHNGVEYNFVPSVGFTHYNEIRYYPVKSVETKTSEETKPYPQIVVEEKPYPPIVVEEKPYPSPAQEYKAPEIAYKAPVHEYSAPAQNYAASEYIAPTVDYALPKIEYTAPKVDYTVPKTEYVAPEIDYTLPKTEIKVPSIDSSPNVEYTAPKIDYTVPKIEYTAPKTDYTVPKTEYTAPTIDYTVPKTEYAAPTVDYTVPKTGYAAPTIDYTVPKTEYAAPTVDYTVPKTGYAAPTIEYTVPKTEYTAPTIDYTVPKTDLSAPVNEYSVPAQDFSATIHDSAAGQYELYPPLQPQKPPAEEYRPADLFRSADAANEVLPTSNAIYRYQLVKSV